MKKIHLILLSALFLSTIVLSACKSNKEKCEEGDWDACAKVLQKKSKNL